MTRVLALCTYPQEAAATRYRLLQFVDPLRRRGIELDVRGDEPFVARADGLSDFEEEPLAFLAEGRVRFASEDGEGSAERLRVAGSEHVELTGAPGEPARLDLEGGWIEAQSIELAGAELTARDGAVVSYEVEGARYELRANLARLDRSGSLEGQEAAGLVLLVRFRPTALACVRRGIAYGALIGLGFVLVENLTYLMLATLAGGEPGLERAVWTRALLGGFHHAVFTASAGAAMALGRGRLVPAMIGLAAAIGQHALWNVVAASRISALLCNAPVPGGACAPSPGAEGLYLWIPLVVVVALGPGLVVLSMLARQRRGDLPPSLVS